MQQFSSSGASDWEKHDYGHHKNVTTNIFEYMIAIYALVGVGWIVVFRPAYKRAGQLMRVIVYLSNPMFVDVYGIWPRVKKQLNPRTPKQFAVVGRLILFLV